MKTIAIASWLFVATCISSFAQEAVEITNEPSHHQVLENESVRVFDVTVRPGAPTKVHRHTHDYLAVAIGDSEIINAKQGAEPATVVFKDGDTRFAAAGLVHAVSTKGDSAFHNITIELLGATTGQHACTTSCSVPLPCDATDKSTCPSADILVSSDQWTATRITMPAGAIAPMHTHASGFLVVPITEVNFKEKAQDGKVTEVHLKPGQVSWSKPITHEATNAGSQTAKLILLEFGKAAHTPPAASAKQ